MIVRKRYSSLQLIMNYANGNRELIEFGQRIETLCKQRGLSIPDLANLMETDYSWLNKIVNGKVDVRISTIHRIAMALEVDITELFKRKK